MVMLLWRPTLISFGEWFCNYLFLTLPCFMYKIGLLNLHLDIWSIYGSLFPLCSGLGAPRAISASWTWDLGILSTFGMSLELPSPSRYLCRLFRCCFTGCSSIEELLFSLFSTMWISGDLSFYLWLRYAKIAVGLFVGSISVSRLVLLCIFSIKVILETLRREDTQRRL